MAFIETTREYEAGLDKKLIRERRITSLLEFTLLNYNILVAMNRNNESIRKVCKIFSLNLLRRYNYISILCRSFNIKNTSHMDTFSHCCLSNTCLDYHCYHWCYLYFTLEVSRQKEKRKRDAGRK